MAVNFIQLGNVTVATSGTPVKLTTALPFVPNLVKVIFQGDPGNARGMFVGASSSNVATSGMYVASGGTLEIDGPARHPSGGLDRFDLSSFYADTQSNGSILRVLAIQSI
jgi:hypothetical protein